MIWHSMLGFDYRPGQAHDLKSPVGEVGDMSSPNAANVSFLENRANRHSSYVRFAYFFL